MGSQLRYAPDNSVVHITSNVIRGQYLMVPGTEFNRLFTGQVRKAQKKHDMKIGAMAVLDTHFHWILMIKNQTQLSRFMCDAKAGIARMINSLRGTGEQVFERPYKMSVLTDNAALMEAYEYLLAHGVKENLVEDSRDWPGVHSAAELCGGPALVGQYFDNAAYELARKIDRRVDRKQFIVRAAVELTPIPTLDGLERSEFESENRNLIESIARKYAEKRGDKPVLGVAGVLEQDPLFIPPPRETSRRPVPRFIAVGPDAKERIKAHWEAYRAMVAAYREALHLFVNGHRPHQFPEGCCVPLLVGVAARLEAEFGGAQPTEPAGQSP